MLGLVGWRVAFNLPFLYLTDCRGYASFFIGTILYLISKKVYGKHAVHFGVGLIIGSIVLISVMGSINWYICILLAFPGILLVTINSQQYEIKAAKFLGNASFEMYLWHIPCFYCIEFISRLIGISIKHSPLTMAIILLYVVFVSSVMYILMENSIRNVNVKSCASSPST
jgi:peptidoglycan/LPS O-acetylase OafA/YrhL